MTPVPRVRWADPERQRAHEATLLAARAPLVEAYVREDFELYASRRHAHPVGEACAGCAVAFLIEEGEVELENARFAALEVAALAPPTVESFEVWRYQDSPEAEAVEVPVVGGVWDLRRIGGRTEQVQTHVVVGTPVGEVQVPIEQLLERGRRLR